MIESGSTGSGESAGGQFHGLILIDKPPGPTAFDCIRFLRQTCNLPKKWKMGHLGTLDPFASGVMVIMLGQAVRYSGFAITADKKYRARLFLGVETDTLDPEGKVILQAQVPSGWETRLDEVASRFTGVISQVPPKFSAKHIDGKRSYKEAREGKDVVLKPVDVEIFSLRFYNPTAEWVDFECHVSKGTYIRALGSEMARSLGTVGYLAGLERIASGSFTIDQAIPFKAFELGGVNVLEHHLRPVTQILERIPSVVMNPEVEDYLQFGTQLGKLDITGEIPDSDVVCINDKSGRFLAMGKVNKTLDTITPFKPWVY